MWNLQLAVVVRQPHVVLLLLVAAENANLADVGRQKAAQHGVAKGTGTASDKEGFITKHSFSL
jgi:hypothetical protein